MLLPPRFVRLFFHFLSIFNSSSVPGERGLLEARREQCLRLPKLLQAFSLSVAIHICKQRTSGVVASQKHGEREAVATEATSPS